MNGELRRWGVPIDDEVRKADLASWTAAVTSTPAQVALLTLWFDRTGASSTDLVVRWEGTSVRIPVELLHGGGR